MSKVSSRWLVNLTTIPAQRGARCQHGHAHPVETCQEACAAHWEAGEWIALSARELMARLESGEYDTEVIVKAGSESKPNPLRVFLRELVWESRSEQRLISSGERADGLYLEIVDLAPIPTALSDLGGRITYVNQAFCDFLGYESEELIGLTVGALSVPDDHEHERNNGNQVIAGKQRGFQMEKRYLHKSGTERIGLLSISLLRDEQGAPTSVMAQVADLSEVKLMQEELMRSQSLAAAGKLAQEVTHDLKNILMVLKGTLDLLQIREEVLDPEELDLIEGGLGVCESGHQLVRSLLDLQSQPSFKPLNLSEWLTQQSSILARFAAPYPFKYHSNLSDDPKFISADVRGLERMLMNLCVNAKQAIDRQLNPERQSQGIEVNLSHSVNANDEGQLILSVRDSGGGIPQSQLSQIAEPYFTTRAQEGGHGLGLAVVWSVCHHHGATLTIESEEGVGSTFNLAFPIID